MLGLFSTAIALTAVVAATLLFALPASAAITNTTFTLEIRDITKTSATLRASRPTAGGLYVQWRAEGAATWTSAQSVAAAVANQDYDSALTLTDKTKYEVEVASDSAYTSDVLTATFWTRPNDQDWTIASNSEPWGIAADASTVWVGDPSGEDVKAYNLTGKTRDSGKDITTTLLAESSPSPFGLYAEGSILWVSVNQTTSRAFDKSGTTPTRSSTNELDDSALDGADNANMSGLWASADYFYVADTADNKIFAYDRANSNAHTPSADIDLHADNEHPQGIWSDGTIIWVADSSDAYIYAYVLATGARYPESDIQPEHANDNPHGLWSTDGEVLWVVDPIDDKVYAYYLPPSPSFGELTGFRIAQLTKTSATVYVDILEDTNSDVHFRWREAGTETWTTEEMSAGDTSSTIYSLTLVDRTKYEIEAAADRDFMVSKIEDVFETRPDDQDWEIDGIGRPWGIADDGTTVWVSDTRDSDILAYNLSDIMRASGKDISETSILDGTGTTTASPYGLYSDGSHLWVVDSQASTDTLVAFDLSGAAPAYSATDTSELTALNVAASDGRGVWANSAYFYVLDQNDSKIYAYDRSNSNAHDSSADITLHADNEEPQGIWSNGTIMWVADSHAEKLFAYNLSDGTRDAESDIRLGHGTSQSARGLWSPDGDVVWVVDSFDEKVYAYYLPPGAVTNNPATGAPSISGVLQQNEELTAATLGIADADGLGTFAYQWLADGTAISGADSFTYTLTADEVGKAISLTVTFTDGATFSEALTSAATHEVVASGATRRLLWLGTITPVDRTGGSVGINLTNNQGSLIPRSFTYGSDTYAINIMDFDPSGLSIVMSPVPGADEEEGWIFDTGREWAVSDGSPFEDGSRLNMYWSAMAGDIDWMIGVESVVYLLEEVNAPPTGAPAITGTPRVGEDLTADTSAIMDANGLTTPSYSYQWVRVDGSTIANIGTDSSTYTLVDADAEMQIRVDVTFTDDGGTEEGPLSSELTATIVPADVLVRNTGQTPESTGEDFDSLTPVRIAQGFTTGADAGGYTLDSIGVHFWSTGNVFSPAQNRISATLNVDNGGEPGAELCRLANPATFGGSGLHTFAAPTTGTDPCPVLAANTTYHVSVANNSRTITRLTVTESDDEEEGGAMGWSIGDTHVQLRGPMVSNPNTWFGHTDSVLIEVRGDTAGNNFATGLPTITGTPRVGQVLTADTSAIMDADGLGTFIYQWVRVDGTDETDVGTNASTYTLTDADADNQIRVEVRLIDGASNVEGPFSSEVTDTIAPSDLLVRNTGETSFTNALSLSNDGPKYGQAFTTGAHPAGYVLGSIGFKLKEIANTGTAGAQLQVTLNEVGSDGHPGTALCTLTDPTVFSASGVQTFHAMTTDSCPTLAASTTYFAVIERVVIPTPITVVSVNQTGSQDQHSASAAGWSIEDDNRFIASGRWRTGTAGPIQIEVRGEVSGVFEVPADWSLIPTGLTSGDTFRLLFVTSAGNPTSSDIATYNSFVQAQAAAGHTDIQDYSAWFRVVGSTADTDARDNTETRSSDTAAAIYWLNGTKVADNYGDFYDGGWDDEANPRGADGATITVDHVWTGSNHNGVEAFGGTLGNVSRAFGASTVRVGRLNHATDGPIRSIGAFTTNTNYPYYALSGVFVVGVANNPPTGAPTISGTPTVGEELTADTSAIMDADGLTTPGYSYQWVRVDGETETNIGTDSSTYTLVGADADKQIRVDVTFTDDESNPEGPLSSALTDTIAAVPPNRVTGFALHSDNATPAGIWGNDDTIWVANNGTGASDKLFAYNRSDGSRDSGSDFSTLNGASNNTPAGICSDGTTMFVADGADDKLYAYKMSDKSHDSTKDISLDSANAAPRGVWCYGTTVYVVNDGATSANKVFAYTISNGNRDSSKDFEQLYVSTQTAAQNAETPWGIWSNGTTMFVVDSADDNVFAYKHSDESQDSDKNITLDTANDDPNGMWFDGRVLWVVDDSDDRLYAYNLPGANPDNTPAEGAPALRSTFSRDYFRATVDPAVVFGPSFSGAGYAAASASPWSSAFGSISESEFTLDGVTYTVSAVYDADRDANTGDLVLVLDQALPRAFTFTAGGTSYSSAHARVSEPGTGFYQYEWFAALSWANADIAVSLSIETPKDGVQVTADPTGITDDTDGVASAYFHYQWVRVDGTEEADIDGATRSTYTPTADDVDKHFKVRVVFNDDEGNQEYPITSPQFGPVVDAVAPTLVSAVADTANTIVLTFDEPLDPDSIPTLSGGFSVAMTASHNMVTTAVPLDGVVAHPEDAEKIVLTVHTVLSRDAFTVSYTKTGKLLQDLNRNEVEPFAGVAVTNEFSDTFVSNLGQTVAPVSGTLSDYDTAQAFTTGSTASFDFTEVEVLFSTAPSSSATVTAIIADGLEATDNIVATLTNPTDWSTNAIFGIPDGTTLAANTTYYLVFEGDEGILKLTLSDDEDAGAADNWTMGNTVNIRTASSHSNLGGTWTESTANSSVQVAIRGLHHGRPGTPELVVTAKDQTLVLEVTVPDNGSSDLTDIEYRVKTTGSYGSWTSVPGTISNSGGTFEIGGRDNGTEYTVQVQTVNAIGTSDASNEDAATPDAPPVITSVAITSDPGMDKTYGIGDDIQVTVTFDKNIAVTTGTDSVPNIVVQIGAVGFQLDCPAPTPVTMQLVCEAGIQEGDGQDSDGISILRNSLRSGNRMIVGPLGQPAVVTHDALADDANHKVDAVRPTLTGARASNDKTKIILTFSEAIGTVDRSKMTFMSGTTTVTATADSKTDNVVEITLNNALTDSDTNVTVALAADAVEDAVGNGNAELAATPVKVVEEIWSATLTVGDLGVNFLGCSSLVSNKGCDPGELLTVNDFSYNGTDYEVTGIELKQGGIEDGRLTFQTSPTLTAAALRDLTLNVNGTSFAFANASGTGGSRRWANSGLTWSENDVIALSIDADPPPMVETAQVATATTINLIFDQGLDSSSLPAATAFAVTVNGNASSASSAAFNTAGDGVILTVGTAMVAWDIVEVTYTPPPDNPLKDAAGNETEEFTVELENLLRDTLVSNLGQTDTMNEFVLSSNDIAQAFTTGPAVGAYTLTGVKIDFHTAPTATATVSAFIATDRASTGTVVANLTNPDTWSATSTFGIPSGTTLDANTTYYLIIEGSDGRIYQTSSTSEDAGAVTGWSIADTVGIRGESTTGVGGTWTNQSKAMQMSVEGIHKGIPGIPDLTLTAKDQAIELEVVISEHGREDLSDIEYRYKATATGTYTEWTSVTSFTNAGGTHEITGLTNGTEYYVQVQGVNDSGNGLPSDEETATPDAPPAITTVVITSDPGMDKTYDIGDDIVVTVTFDKVLTLTGTGDAPNLTLTIGTVEKQADCVIGSPTTTLTCTHTVAENDEDTNGISTGSNALKDPDSRLVGPLGQNAVLTHSALAADSDHLVDGVRPKFTGARASADNTKITLTFSEAIGAVDSTKITFDSGGTTLTHSSAMRSGSEVVVTLTNPLTATDTMVTVALAAAAVYDAVGNGNAVLAATRIVDDTPPALSTATTPSNTEVLLTYNEPLDSTSIPAASAFAVTANASLALDVWSGTLTVQDTGGGFLGCNSTPGFPDGDKCSTSTTLTDYTFSYDSRDYEITNIEIKDGILELITNQFITPATARDLTLHVGATRLEFSDAPATGVLRRWTGTGLTWTEGQVVTLSIDRGTSRTVSTAALDGTSAIKLTVSPAFRPGDALTVSYTVPETNPIKDASANEAEALVNQAVDNTLPATAPDAVVSMTAANTSTFGKVDLTWDGDTWANGSAITKHEVRYYTPIWDGTLTVKEYTVGGNNLLGCDSAEANVGCTPSEQLNDNTFSYDSVDYVIGRLFVHGGSLTLGTTGTALGATALTDLALRVGDRLFPFADAASAVTALTWANTGISWSENDAVSLSIGTLSAWTDVPDSAPGGANHTGHTLEDLALGRLHTFQVRAVNDVGGGDEASFNLKLLAPVWEFTLRDSNGNDVTELTEGGDSATATVTITNADQATFDTAQEITLQWGGTEITGPPIPIRGAGNTSTITIPAEGSSGSLDISSPQYSVDNYEYPYTLALTAHHGEVEVGSISLTRRDDENPPVASITMAPESVDEGEDIEMEISLNIAYFAYGTIEAAQRTVKFSHTDSGSILSGTPPTSQLLSLNQKVVTITLPTTGNTTQNDGARTVTFSLETSTDASYTLDAQKSSVTIIVRDDDTPPLAVEDLRAQAGNTEATLHWGAPKAPTPDHGQPILHYEYRVKAGMGSFGNWTMVPNSDGTTTSHKFTGLTNGTVYTYELRAENVAGDGAVDDVTVTPRVGVPVTFGAAAASVTEGGTVTVTVTLDEAPATGVTVVVPITPTAGTGLGTSEYTGVPANVTFNAGDTSKSFTVTTVQDTIVETDEELTLSLGTLPTGYVTGTNSMVVITVVDNDEPEWALTLRRGSTNVTQLTEGGAQATARVSITNGVQFETDQEITLQWGGQEITSGLIQGLNVDATITITAGQSAGTLFVGAPQRTADLYRPPETKTLTAHLDGGNQIGNGIELTYVDDEDPPVFTIRLEDTRVVEGDDTELIATLSRGYDLGLVLLHALATGATTRLPGLNMIDGQPGELLVFDATFPTLVMSGLGPTGNSTAGDHATITFTIPSNPDYYTIGTPSTATLLILDDDAAPSAPRSISARPGDAEATLRWTRPANYDQVWVSDYQYRQRPENGAWTSWAVIPDSDGATTSHTFTGLTNRTEYTFEVRARNSNNNGAVAQVMVTPSPRPPTTVSITASVSEPVRAPFRVTITFTDQDMDGIDTDGIEGFEADDIIAYYTTENHGSYEFRVTGFREVTPGKVYSALVDQIIDGKLWIEVEEGAAQSKLDGAVNTGSYTTWQVDAPALPSAPEGETIWSDNLRIGGEDIRGYFVDWSSVTGRDERFGELPNANFSYNGTAYEIEELIYTNTWRALEFEICPTLEGANSNFWLHLGEDSKAVSFGGDYISTRDFTRTRDGTQLQCTRYRWNPIELNWPKGKGRNVKITVTEGNVAERPVVTSVALTSNPNNDGRPGSDSTYAIGDSVTATVTFDKAVDVTGSSQITLLFGTAEKAAACAAATNTRTMACTYQVAAGDTAPTGVGIKANTLLLDGGTIYASGSVTTRANLAHQGLGLQSGHKVDGIRPTLVTTGSGAPRTFSDGIRIQLTFSEDIEEATPSLFTIESNSVELPLGNQVSINARTVVLRLATALTDSTASLTVALDAEAVEDVPGNTNLARSAVTLLNSVGVAPTGPDAPTGLTATPAPDEAPQLAVTLTWTAPASDGGSAITAHQYHYSRNSGSFGGWMTIPNSSATGENATSFTVKGLGAVNNVGTQFTFEVRAVNENANGARSDPASAIIGPPGDITNLVATPGDGKIELSWDTPDNRGSAIRRYQYWVNTSLGSGVVVAIGTNIPNSNADTTSFTITGLTNGVPYDIRVRAVNAVGPGGSALAQGVTPATFPTAPRNLRAEPGDTQVTLRWTAPLSDGGKVIEEYQYQQKTGNSAYGAWTTITGSDDTTTGHDVTGLTNGTSYSFKVRAKNSVGEGPESNVVTVVPVTGPSAPTGLTATPAPDETPQLAIDLAWTAPTDDGGSAIRSHQYRYSRNSGSFGSWTTIPNSSATGPNATSFTVRGLSAVDNTFTTFQFQVRAVNANANGSESDTTSTSIGIPLAPLNLEGTSGDRRVEVTWDTPGNNGSKILKYQYVVTDLSTNVDIIPAGTDIPGSDGDTTSFTVTGLTNGVLYTISVNAVNSVGPGRFATKQGAAPATFPTAPRNLRAEAGDTQVTLRWTAPLYNGGYDVSGYEYQQKTSSGDYGSWMDITGADDTTTEHTVTGLTNGTSYSFKVRAKNEVAGEGPASNEATAVPVTVPSAPQSFNATAGNGKVTLDWTAPASDGGNVIRTYEFRYKEGSGAFTMWATVPNSNVNTTTHTVRNLTNGTVHTFEVRAATATHKGVSASDTATPMAVKPDKPSVTVDSRPEALSVSWTVSDDGGSDITEYHVQWKSGSGSFGATNQQTGLTTTNTLIESLTNHTDYDVRVRARNTIGWSDWSDAATGTPMPRPAPSVSITASVSEPVTAAFRVTFTFTDQDLDGNDTNGVTGFEADEIIAYYTTRDRSSYEFRVTDFREETPGKVYSVLVDKIVDGKLWIEVEEGSVQSKLDGQGNTAGLTTWQVDAPDLPSAPDGTPVWSDTLGIAGAGTGTGGYFVGWSQSTGRDERFGSLPNANFTYNGTDYEIDELSYTESLRTLRLRICPLLQGADSSFWLHIGDGNKAVSFGADYMSTRDFRRTKDGTQLQCKEYNWTPIDLDWPSGQSKNVKITRSDAGSTTVSVSFTDDRGNSESLTSEATVALAATTPTEPLSLTVATGDQVQELDVFWAGPVILRRFQRHRIQGAPIRSRRTAGTQQPTFARSVSLDSSRLAVP